MTTYPPLPIAFSIKQPRLFWPHIASQAQYLERAKAGQPHQSYTHKAPRYRPLSSR